VSWWGKVVGGAFGFMLGGPLGALLGAAVGHRFDKGLGGLDHEALESGDQERIQSAFFTATFSVMGHIAKADGKVTADEIRMAEHIMGQMHLSAEMRKTAQRLFNEGKAADFPLAGVLEQFRRECQRRRNLIRMFIEIQLHAAYADGALHANEAAALKLICRQLGISEFEFRQLETIVRAAHHFSSGGGQRGRTAPPRKDLLKEAYALLGVKPSDSDADIKKAYRRLMNQHHPDKLVAKGLPEEMISMATQKTQEIKAAYETIKAARKP